MPDTQYHIVVFGATSFVGQILCEYLSQRYGEDGELRWAAAGRSLSKLKTLRENLGRRDLDLVVADANDPDSLADLCAQTQVVISTVGPYALYGEPMVKACVAAGTDYCDLTGEVQWIRRMIDRYQAAARASGARIVHCCGFDSLPSDMGVFFLQQQARRRFDGPCTRIKMRVKAMRGGFSGGTFASLMNVAKEASRDRALRKELADPYSLCPHDRRPKLRQPNVKFGEYDSDFNSWIAPFVMGTINTRIVHRSNALLEQAYGPKFQYDEAVLTGRELKGRLRAYGMSAGLGGFVAGAALAPARWALERFVLPKSGEGPSRESQHKGFYDIRFYGETPRGQSLRVKVAGDRDPGYGSTSKMLGEAGACLALDIGRAEPAGGFWTPATIFGERLIERLQAHAGLTFEAID